MLLTIQAAHGLNLSIHCLQLLCIATSMSIQQPFSRLMDRVVLAEFMDSLSRVEFVMLLEALFSIEIPDQDTENLLTFEDVLCYAQLRLSTNSAVE
jgi:acyl carrier protein